MWIDELLGAETPGETTQTTVVEIGEHRVPVALNLVEGSSSLCVLCNGALDRSRSSSGVVFQRSSWAPEIRSNTLFVADGALLTRPRGSLGWGQFSKEYWVGDLVPSVVREVADALDIEAQRVLHFGSSAGGFQALIAAAAQPGSRALVNNPQTDWLKYEPASAVDAVLRDSFGGMSRQDLLHTYPWRARVWEWFAKQAHIPEFTYVVNSASRDDIRNQLEPCLRALSVLAEEHPSAKWHVQYYFDSVAGHSPLAKVPALLGINRALDALR